MPAKTAAVDDLTAAFRPIFTEQGAAQARSYVETLEAMEQQLATERSRRGRSPGRDTRPARRHARHQRPDRRRRLRKLPQILARTDALVTVVETNLHNFELADSIPTAGLPTTAVTWQLMALPPADRGRGVGGVGTGRRRTAVAGRRRVIRAGAGG